MACNPPILLTRFTTPVMAGENAAPKSKIDVVDAPKISEVLSTVSISEFNPSNAPLTI